MRLLIAEDELDLAEALKESEEEFSKTYSGVLPFIRRVIPGKTNAQHMEAEDVTSSEE